MPTFNPFTGEVLAGVAGMQPSVDGVSKGPAGSTSPTVWFDTDNILHQVSGALSKTNIRTNTTVTLGGATNELSGGCKGKYLAWGSVGGLFGEVTLPLGGLNRVSTDARGAAASDGSLAYIGVRANPGPTTVRSNKGAEVQLPGDPYGMHILKWGQAVWNSLTVAGGLEFWGTICAYIPSALNAKLVKLGSDLWIVYYHGGDVIAHKAIGPTVYYTVTSSFAYHMDAIAYGGKLAVCFSATTGEAPGDITKIMDVVGTCPSTAVPGTITVGGGTAGPTVPPDEIVVQEEKIGKFPQFADLKVILAQTKETENPLYQTVQQIIDRLVQAQGVTIKAIQQGDRKTEVAVQNANLKGSNSTYLTKEDETLTFPNSVQLLAGTGVAFDDSVPNKRTINVVTSGLGNHYDAPLSDGDLAAADLIYANGECIIVQVPV